MMNNQNSPDQLDALIAAPQYHSLMLENEFVRVLDTCVPAGQTVPLHTHRWPAAQFILRWSDFVRRDADGNIQVDSRTLPKILEGTSVWSAPLPPHTLENVGAYDLRVISVEVKSST